jgi:Cu/Ag efflux protein CusF
MDMKKCLFAFSLIFFLATLGLAMTAQDQSTSSAQKAVKTVSGEVVSVDSTKHEIVIKDDAGAELRLMCSKSTKVTREGKTIALADVKPADKVTCEAEESSGSWIAKSIRVGSMKTD